MVTEGLRPVDELRALRRIATLVAEGVPPQQLFAVVADEVARVLDVPTATVLRYEPDGSVTSWARSENGPALALGTRFVLDGPSLLERIQRTGKPARIDDYSMADGELPPAVRVGGVRAAVGAPIVVSGRLWGAMVVSNPNAEPLPDDTEAHLADFTELLATAIANAESHDALERLADEQAALRRVAMLVAGGAPPRDIFVAVSDEVDALFDCGAGVARFEAEPPAMVFAGVSKRITVPIGTRFEFQDGMASVEVHRTHRSARVDDNDWSFGDGALATTARRVGLVSSVASPIVVDGRLWGTMNLWSRDAPLPPDTGERLEKFTELIATAIANAESREAARLLTDEQAALRRVATLVGQGVAPAEIFSAVSDEVDRLFGCGAGVLRFEHDPPAIIFAGTSKNYEYPIGTRWPLEQRMASAEVYRTHRPARVDGAAWSATDGPFATWRHQLGIVSAVASPIVVEGRLWGTMNLWSADKVLPADTGERLESFTELVATAIANAESRAAIGVLADEQAALRHIATLVARCVPPDELFAAVSDEVGQLFGSNAGSVARFEHDPPAIVLVGFGKGVTDVPVGTRSPLNASLVQDELYRTGRSARLDDRDFSLLGEPLREAGERLGLVSSIASPITVNDRLWGALNLSATEPLPAGSEVRLERFAELVGIAIASAEAQAALQSRVEEQAALQRVAILVAEVTAPSAIFSAVSREVEALFDAAAAAVVKFEDDPPSFSIAGTGEHMQSSAIGARYELVDGYASTAVYRTGHSARNEARRGELLDGPVYGAARDIGSGGRLRVTSAVASPLTVGGRLWGALSVSAAESLPPDAEDRLERFADIVATAIANADSQQALAALASEQAALRRVATLAAQSVPAPEIFHAVAEEVAGLFDENLAAIGKFDLDAPVITFVGLANPVAGVEIGARVEISDETPAGQVYETGRPARMDRADWSTATSAIGHIARSSGIVSSVCSPIIVDGRVWGAISALSATKTLPTEAESRLARFSELLATAIANAESRDALRLLADEQAALRRVATLVAQGVPAAEIFRAVSQEIAGLFGEDLAAIGKFDADGGVTPVGITKPVEGLPLGTRVVLSEETPAGSVYATGRAARLDRADWTAATSELGRISRQQSFVSLVCSPIIVEGRLWGCTTALSSTKLLPPDTEGRLERFSELIATAIANAESRSELAESRRRIVAASDEARRRIERNLHDGTQQRLVALALAVRATEADVPPGLPNTRSELAQIAAGLTEAAVELQEIARGLHPASLEQRGLGAALRTLARRSPIPVELDIAIDGRLPEPVQVAAYYVASEALANAAKYADASFVEVSLARPDDDVIISVRDDGLGGADPARGSGLVGLTDRVEALGGSLEVRSPSGHGTCITAVLPVGAETE